MLKLSSLLQQIIYRFPLEEFGFIKIDTMMCSFLSQPGNLVLYFFLKKSGVRHFNQSQSCTNFHIKLTREKSVHFAR